MALSRLFTQCLHRPVVDRIKDPDRGELLKGMERMHMFEQCLTHDGHTRRFRIKARGGEGWEVLEEQDSAVIRAKVYDDWHRVERARTVFEAEILQLTAQGWVRQPA